jgi:hypothetical protein
VTAVKVDRCPFVVTTLSKELVWVVTKGVVGSTIGVITRGVVGETGTTGVVVFACRLARAYTLEASSLFSCSNASMAC